MAGSPAVIVCIPAHDEAERIARVLASLARQSGFDRDRRLPVIVLANNCGDGTAEEAKAFGASAAAASLELDVVVIAFPSELAHVGTARRKVMDLAVDRLAARADGVLLTTDADARLPPGWVGANLAALAGAEIVGGRLIVDQEVPDPRMAALNRDIGRYWAAVRAIEDRFDPPPHDPPPRHGDHTGASLALSASTYRAVGGLPALPRGEDNALVARVVEAGGRLRHDPAVSVSVSDRAVGRAAGGMATEMVRRTAVLKGSDAYRLPSPAHWRHIVQRRAALRASWRRGLGSARDGLAALDLPDEAVVAIAPEACPNDIAFVERTHRQLELRDDPAPLVPLAEALAGFATLLDPR